jgi:hypothetical protein
MSMSHHMRLSAYLIPINNIDLVITSFTPAYQAYMRMSHHMRLSAYLIPINNIYLVITLFTPAYQALVVAVAVVRLKGSGYEESAARLARREVRRHHLQVRQKSPIAAKEPYLQVRQKSPIAAKEPYLQVRQKSPTTNELELLRTPIKEPH